MFDRIKYMFKFCISHCKGIHEPKIYPAFAPINYEPKPTGIKSTGGF